MENLQAVCRTKQQGGIIMSKDILDEIIAHKRIKIAAQEQNVPISFLEDLLEKNDDMAKVHSMKASLAASATGIIAEFKRRSPSKDWINRDADAKVIPASYQQAGASALSILTDEHFFGGGLRDIRAARPTVSLPILRKDFIISRYQLLQAKAAQADAVLLIAAALSKEGCSTLACEAHKLGLEVLLEMHHEGELDYVNEHVDMAGINNRNLGTFHTDVENSFRMAEKLPADILKVSESGISNPQTVKLLRQEGFRGFLIGETFMKTANPGNTLSTFIKELES